MFSKPGSLHGGPGQKRRHELRVCGLAKTRNGG